MCQFSPARRVPTARPFSTMLDYSTQLRSITAGEGSFTMKFSHYEAVPPNIQQDVVKSRKAAAQPNG